MPKEKRVLIFKDIKFFERTQIYFLFHFVLKYLFIINIMEGSAGTYIFWLFGILIILFFAVAFREPPQIED